MDVASLTEALKLVTVAGGAVGVAVTGLGLGWRKTRRAYRWVKQQLELLEELRPNGGGSIKDQVTRLEQTTSQHFARIEANGRADRKRLEKVEREVAQLKEGRE